MREVIRSFFITVLLGFFTVASAQLPSEIMVDKHLILAEQLFEKKDYAGAFNVMEKIIALQKEHGLTLSNEFHFKYARVALSADSLKIAFDSVSKYLSATGRNGEFYKEALALLLKAEGPEVSAEETCTGKPESAECWKELESHPQCYIWIEEEEDGFGDYDDTRLPVTWSGECSSNLADGKGTLTWHANDDSPDKHKII